MLTVNLSYVMINIVKEQSTTMKVGEVWPKKGQRPDEQKHAEEIQAFFVLN